MSVRMRIRDSLSQAAKISYNPHDSHVRRSRRGDRSQSPSVDSPPEPSLTSSFCRRLMACISGTLTVVRTRSSRATVKRGCPPLTEVVRSMHVLSAASASVAFALVHPLSSACSKLDDGVRTALHVLSSISLAKEAVWLVSGRVSRTTGQPGPSRSGCSCMNAAIGANEAFPNIRRFILGRIATKHLKRKSSVPWVKSELKCCSPIPLTKRSIVGRS
jgi:hypothetical protein